MNEASHLGNLFLLVQVIEAGGFAAAARQMGITRSMASRRIIALEKQLGVRLLHRNARSFAVTTAGEQVYRHAVIMCDAARAATAAAREAQGMDGGLLRIGAPDLLLPWLTDVLAAFTERHALTRLALTSNHDPAGLMKLHTDVIIGTHEQLPDSSDIVARPLGRMRLVVVASPALLQRLGHPRHPDQVDDKFRLGHASHELPQGWTLRGAHSRRQQPRLLSDHLPTLLAAARSGMGYAQLPMYACHDDLASGRLCLAFEAFEARPLPVHALALRSAASGEAVLRFIQFARQHLSSMLPRGMIATDAPA